MKESGSGGIVVFALFALLASFAAATHGDTTTVTAAGFAFTPPDIVINSGDTVHWHLVSGGHTVTNGTGSADPSAGSYIDSPLDFTNTDVYWTYGVAAGTDTAGVYPYFCRPHEFLGMKGTITVQALNVGVPLPDGPAGTVTTWGELKSLFTTP